MTSGNDSQRLWKRYVSRRAALRAGVLGAAIPGLLYVAKSADSADAADSNVYIPGAPNFLELGYGRQGKEANAGKITYQQWSDALDVVGAGTAAGYRKVKIWDDLYVQGLVNLRAYVVDPQVPPNWTAFLYAKSVNGQTRPFWKDTTGTAQPLVSRSATLIVAASNASPRSKLGADYVCDGTADEVEINAAITALPSGGGKVVLTEGAFSISASSQVSLKSRITLEGQGMGQTLLVKAAGGTSYETLSVAGTGNTDVVIRGLKVDVSAFGATDNYPVSIYHVTRLTLDSLMVVGDSARRMGTLWIDSSNQIKIVSCVFQYICKLQISGDPGDWDDTKIDSDDVLIQGCSFLNLQTAYPPGNFAIGNVARAWKIIGNHIDGTWSGIDLCFSPEATIIGNTIRNSTTSAIYSEAGRHLTIVGNVCVNTGGASIAVSQAPPGAVTPIDKPGKVIIANNLVERCGYDSIAAYGIRRVLITGNIVIDSARHGIEMERKTVDGVDYFPGESIVANNFVYGYGASIEWARGICCYDADDVLVYGNQIDSISSGYHQIGIGDNATASGLIIRDNRIVNCETKMGLVGSGHIVRDNVGYVTENNGVATITSGSTYIDVAHGLDRIPAAEDISVTPTNTLGNASKFWISDVGASTFRINVNSTPGATTATFAWRAEVL